MSQELLKKADMVLADLSSNGGRLNPEQSDRFLKVLIESPTILRDARTVPMNSPEMKINKIGFGSRILRPATENTALSQGDRSKPETFQINLQTKEVIAEVRIPYSVLEDNIEKESLENTILQLIAERAAEDLEELFLLGDTGDSDPYLAMMNGFLKRLTSNTVDAAATANPPGKNSAQTYSNAIKALAPRFRRNLNLLKFYVAPDVQQDYRQVVANRQTVLGDAVLAGKWNPTVHGVELDMASLMPSDTGILTNPQNLIVGIQRNFQIESQRLIRERQIVIVLTARIALAIETEEAAVKISHLV
jgi:HK97 family phage major capsid protein